jgi:hypothetical protein
MRAQRSSSRAHGGSVSSGPRISGSQRRIGPPPLSGAPVSGNMRYGPVALFLCIGLGACASNPLPPPNSIRTTYDRNAQAIQVYISNAQMPRDAWLVDVNGTRYPLILTLVSGPHVNYSAPPTIGLGLGGFGWNVGGGAGVGFPLGSSLIARSLSRSSCSLVLPNQGQGSLRGRTDPPQHLVRSAGAAMSTTSSHEPHVAQGPPPQSACTFALAGNFHIRVRPECNLASHHAA